MKGESKSVLEREIGEQPESIARTVESCAREIDLLARDVRARDITSVMIAARGSSDNAGVYAKYLFQAFNGLPVMMATPSLYTFYHTPPRLRNVMVLGISQSGQSEDIVEVMADARRQGALTAVVTADSASPMAAQADHVLQLQTGPERAVAATKTFTASLAILAALSAALEKDDTRMACIKELPERSARTLALSGTAAAARAERYRYKIGRAHV